VPGVDRGKERLVRARERNSHPWLDYSVALGDTADFLILIRAVQWMRDRSDQKLGRVPRQYRV
jgi:hypothetical protein